MAAPQITPSPTPSEPTPSATPLEPPPSPTPSSDPLKVVCKGGAGGADVWMVKVKTDEYLGRLKQAFAKTRAKPLFPAPLRP